MWNLGNEPDLFAWPASAAAGRAWVRDMRSFVRDIDPDHPVTCGLHVDSLVADNHLRVDDVFAETDVAVMHGYPMYASWARDPLDADFVPFVCALTSAMCAKPVLAEEWGGCTVPGGGPSQTWEWIDHAGAARTQFMAGEDALAEHVAAVLPKLVDVGATGALLWCFADYAEHLWDRPPCDPRGAIHERHFGLVRPDGTLKPHAEAVRRFAATRSDRASRRGGPSSSASAPMQYYADPLGSGAAALRRVRGAGHLSTPVTAADRIRPPDWAADVPPCRSPDPARHRRPRAASRARAATATASIHSNRARRSAPIRVMAAARTHRATLAMIGDSITFMSTEPLQAELSGTGLEVLAIDAQVGRRITVGERGQPYPGTDIVEFIANSNPPDVWVIALGTNDIGQYADAGEFAAQVQALLDLLPEDAPLVWVDTWDGARLDQTRLVNDTLRAGRR